METQSFDPGGPKYRCLAGPSRKIVRLTVTRTPHFADTVLMQIFWCRGAIGDCSSGSDFKKWLCESYDGDVGINIAISAHHSLCDWNING